MLRASTNSAWNSPWNNVPTMVQPVQPVQPQQQAPPQQFASMGERWGEPTELVTSFPPSTSSPNPMN